MLSPQQCPSRAAWQALLEGRVPDSSAGEHSRHLEDCPACRSFVEELTGSGRTWLDLAAVLGQPAAPLPPAGRRALEQIERRKVRSIPFATRSTVTARLHIERMMHRSSIAVPGESAACYTLIKLIPSGLGGKPPGLNLALALDVSGSMYEEDGTGVSRLKRVQDAAVGALPKLRPTDTLAVVGFAHNALMLLPPTPIAQKDRIEEVIRRVDGFDIDPGGTALDEGLALALNAVKSHAGPGVLSQIVVLTDGETSGEQNCRALARHAAAQKVRLALMGVGLDWKASLVKDLAALGQGKWYYIDADEAGEASRIFGEEFEALTASAFLDVEMILRPMKDVLVKRVRQVVPEIRELPLDEREDRTVLARLGTLQNDSASRYILDLNLPRRPDGKYVVAQLELTYDPGTGRRESTGPMSLEMSYTAGGHGYANAEVMKHIDEIRLAEMSDTLHRALQHGDSEAARQAAEELVKQGELMGPGAKRKTQLALQVLEELTTEGTVQRKTQLELDDAVRIAEIP